MDPTQKLARIARKPLFIAVSLLAWIEPVMAGPGGSIARVVKDSFWAKLVLLLLAVIFLPLIVLGIMRQRGARRRTRRDLTRASQFNSDFQWIKLKQRATDCFRRVHSAWSREDTEEASEWMTDWYWQNQKLTVLEDWKRRGLQNHCEIKKIARMEPIYFLHQNDGGPHEGSVVVIAITANMQDYLAGRDTGEVVEGDKKFKDVRTLWSFTYADGKWRVSNIEEDEHLSDYLESVYHLPAIEDTLPGDASGSRA